MSDCDTRRDSIQRLLAICGIVGPILFAVVVVTLGFLEPGYNHATQFISDLGAVGARYAIVMNSVGFLLLGLLMIAFAWGLDRGVRASKCSKIGPAMVAVLGITVVVTGIFPCDPGEVEVTMAATTHTVLAVVAGVAIILAPLTLAPRLNKDNRWQGYAAYSLGTGVVVLVVHALYQFNVLESWDGALQRVVMGVALVWVEVMAIRLLRLS